jgi:hypothetical protein
VLALKQAEVKRKYILSAVSREFCFPRGPFHEIQEELSRIIDFDSIDKFNGGILDQDCTLKELIII